MLLKSYLAYSFLGLILLFVSGCSYHPNSVAYRSMYTHLNQSYSHCQQMQETPYFLVLLVEARHLDYSCPTSFFKTLAKHPSDGSKNGDVGHAWIYLHGDSCIIEGGHSGELGYIQPRYMEGVFQEYECGNPNPISYLWESQYDGFFQSGSGHHWPTFAVKVDLSRDQYARILKFIQCYDYSEYAITGNQCSSFVAQVAAFADLDLECEITIKVAPYLHFSRHEVSLWKNPVFSEITFSSPDILERSLMQAVADGKAEYAMSWYQKTHPRKNRLAIQDIVCFPQRYIRFKSL